MNYASGSQRAFAWIIDFIILVTVLLGTSRLVWFLMPETYIEQPFQAMQLYTKRESETFFYTFIIFTIFVAAYQILLPLSPWEGTPGHRLAKIRLVRPDGKRLDVMSSIRRFFATLIKCFIIFFTGPIIALLGGNEALSMLFLVAPIAFVFISYLFAIDSPEGAWLWEVVGNYRFVRRG